ncbi:MAG: outer membrane beta-barrel protein [Verrucomicrobiota bacterium]
MNRLFVSAGLAALSAVTLESAMADDATGPKYWSIGGTLRGFYDDNYNTSATDARESFGFEVLPTVSVHVPLQTTDMGIRYTYGFYYYQDREDRGQTAYDQTHQVDLWLDHAFNERWKSKITDTFAVGQEPELLTPNPVTGLATPYRIDGDNISNHGGVELDTDWTRLLSTSLTYENGFYDYSQNGAMVVDNGSGPTVVTGGVGGPSLAGILDRVEEAVSLDVKWHLQPETTVFVGYQFAWVNFNGNEPIAVANVPGRLNPVIYNSSDRDSYTHYGYVGLEQDFTPNLSATVKVGASYNDVYADPVYPTTDWYPYADLSLSWTYLPGSYVQLGFTHDLSATDQVTPNNVGELTQNAENSVVYVDINHRITQKLVATLIGRVQYTTYNGGAASSEDTTDYGVGLNLSYQINNHLSVDAGYNYDDVTTDIANYGYNRNRVYLGLTANY